VVWAVGAEANWVPGALVGKAWRLGDRIGEGGFGSVFRAVREADGLPAAIKILSREAMGRDDGIARFQREANLAMRLRHESTIRVLGSGDAGDGTPFIAFELLEGTSLDVLLAAGALSQGKALTVANALLGSLGEAHGLGIIHRDVKPANVFVCTRPDGLVKLLDFGVAKSTEPTNEMGLTRDGLMVGTPAYMAPEQISGKGLGPQTDLYAVALVLGEMLSGKPMYDGASLQVCMDKLRGVMPPIDPRIATAPFFRVMERALAVEASKRYATADAMRDDLRSTGVHPESLRDTRRSRTSSSVSAKGTEILESPVSGESANPSSPYAQKVQVRGSYPSDPSTSGRTDPHSDARSDPQLPFKDTIDPRFALSDTLGVATPQRRDPAALDAPRRVDVYGATHEQRPLSGYGTGQALTPSAPPREATLSTVPTSSSYRTLKIVVIVLVVLAITAVAAAVLSGPGKRRLRSDLALPAVTSIG
jgi:serine/threonine protein kinase